MKKAPTEAEVISPVERAKLFGALPLRIRLIAETLYARERGSRRSMACGVTR